MPTARTLKAVRRSQRHRQDPEAFAAAYGAAPADVEKVRAFLERAGLKVDRVHLASRMVVATGTAEQVSAAFGVDLDVYRIDHPPRRGGGEPDVETYRGRDGSIHVPRALAPAIVGVFGLDNRRITKRNAADPGSVSTLSVPQIRGLYDFPPNAATGQTIAVLSIEGYQYADVQAFFAAQPVGALPAMVDVPVLKPNSGAASPETTQDICIAGAAAPGAGIATYFTTDDEQGWVHLINRVLYPEAGDPICSVITCSYYLSNGDDAATRGQDLSDSLLLVLSAAFKDATSHHVTVCVASGDTGTDSKMGKHQAYVQYPASDPNVLCVGGTTVGNIGAETFDEYVWNDAYRGVAYATGGGVSAFFAVPDYQKTLDPPASLTTGASGRALPDVAANASPNSGYLITVAGQRVGANGTSAAAPLWAGLIAVMNAALGTQLGFLNPIVYQIGSAGFRDVVGAPGAADNGLNGAPGYPAGAGWDACTGWGSPRGQTLLAAIQQTIAVG
jgi:kumamolisin